MSSDEWEISSYKKRLAELFSLIDQEMETLYTENITLRNQIKELSAERVEGPISSRSAQDNDLLPATMLNLAPHLITKKKHQLRQQKWKTAFRGPTGKFPKVALKSGGNSEVTKYKIAQIFKGNMDCCWHVSTTYASARHIVGSASADQTARIWVADDPSQPFITYTGHTGSVNSISFSPQKSGDSQLVVLTASGDRTAHIFSTNLEDLMSEKSKIDTRKGSASESVDRDDVPRPTHQIEQPKMCLTGHSDVVCSGEWIFDSNQVITASWDRTANLYDAETGKIIKVLTGHDHELTSCSSHPSQKLVATSSKDSTFRLWDFREAIQSVAVFQGHNDTVTSSEFSQQHHIISASDDRTVKVWDLRNMKSPILAIRLNSQVNKVAISQSNILAIPQDSGHISLYDLQGNRLGRISNAEGRMVCACKWLNGHSTIKLISCGLDKQQVIGWGIELPGIV